MCVGRCVIANLPCDEIQCWRCLAVEQEVKGLIQRRQGSQSDADTSVEIEAADIPIDPSARPEFEQKQTTLAQNVS